MNVRKRTLAAAAALGVLLVVGLAAPAIAEGAGGYIHRGDHRCSYQVQSDNGINVVGRMTYGTGEWTVRRASTVGGVETVVFRAPAGSMSGVAQIDQSLASTAVGVYLYRLCLDVNQVQSVYGVSLASYSFSITSTSPTAVTGIGPDTANLSRSSRVCGDITAVPGHRARLVGTASASASWRLYVVDHSPAYQGSDAPVLGVDGDNIDRTVVLHPEILSVHFCVQNTGSSVVSVSFELFV